MLSLQARRRQEGTVPPRLHCHVHFHCRGCSFDFFRFPVSTCAGGERCVCARARSCVWLRTRYPFTSTRKLDLMVTGLVAFQQLMISLGAGKETIEGSDVTWFKEVYRVMQLFSMDYSFLRPGVCV